MAQVLNGKGFEYACLQSIRRHLSNYQEINIITTPALLSAQLSYNNLEPSVRQQFDMAADAAIRVLTRLEPQLEDAQQNDPLILTIQHDANGRKGDVRDVLAIRRQNQWEIGLSAKNNHTAVKHSRLSQTIDFGNEWMGYPVSKRYFNEIKPIFDELEELRIKNLNWNQIERKAERFYVPILEAFMNELQRLYQANLDVPSRLLQYLIGRNDFYKVIAHARDRTTEIQGFSMYGTLNRPSRTKSPMLRIRKLRFPKTFHSIDFKPKSKTTIYIVCDEGWTVSARIHSASKKVEPSLKFDIQLIGMPPDLFRHIELW